MKKIKFTLVEPQLEYCAEFPSPSIRSLPDWYKNMPSFTSNKKEFTDGVLNETVKKCIPVLDSMSSGYIIKLWTDVYIEKTDGNMVAIHTSAINSGVKAVEGHHISQVSLYPFPEGYKKEVLKWRNPWHIQTPKGYSCLFTTPINHDLPFKIFDGVVDTDTFPLSINFPFLIKNNFYGIIPAGTPIAQVIPFKRDSFSSERGIFNADEYQKLTNLHDSSFTNKYKTKWWSRKKYD
jgi:hypothetical protein